MQFACNETTMRRAELATFTTSKRLLATTRVFVGQRPFDSVQSMNTVRSGESAKILVRHPA